MEKKKRTYRVVLLSSDGQLLKLKDWNCNLMGVEYIRLIDENKKASIKPLNHSISHHYRNQAHDVQNHGLDCDT